MLIADLEFALIEAPARQGPAVRSLIVRLLTDTGIEGWGESTAIWRVGELVARRDLVLPLLADRNVFDVEELLTLDVLASAPLRSAIEMACWDAIGRQLKQPLFRLWGGLYRPRIPVAARLPLDSPEGTARFARELSVQGYRTLIITAAGQCGHDAMVAQAVRDAIGGRAPLRIDGGRRFDRESAQELCRLLEPLGIQAAIDILAANDFVRHADLEQHTTLPLAVCQLVHGPRDLFALARTSRSPQAIVNLDLVGGLTTARKCAAAAEAAGVALSLGGASRLGIAAAAQLHLAAATPYLTVAHEFSCHLLLDDLISERFTAGDGFLGVPQGPGLGVEIDRDRFESLAARE
jgi:L-alanine-DL-glutamate epimerase-like enolase superfamily enzyme